MKLFILNLLVLLTLSSNASAYSDVQLSHSGGEIRFGSTFGEATFVSFYDYLTIELAKKGQQVTHNEKPTVISYKFILDGETFYNIFPKAKMKIKISNNGFTVTETFKCSPEINDGGNVTIKEKCAKKTARKIISLFKSEGF